MKQSQKRQAKLSAVNSFEVIAREFHAMKAPIWTVHHATDWINTMEREVFPKLGHRPITEIEAPDVLDILRTIEARGAFEVRGQGAAAGACCVRLCHCQRKIPAQPGGGTWWGPCPAS